MKNNAKNLVLALLPALLVSGCLISATKVFEFDVVQDGNGGQPIDVTGSSFEMVAIDLTTNDVFEEHSSDVKQVDRVGFTATVDNASGSATSMTILFDRNDLGAPVLLGEALPILSGIQLAASGSTEITYAQSEAAIQNFEAFQKAVAEGKLRLICLANDAIDFSITEMVLVVTFTVGL